MFPIECRRKRRDVRRPPRLRFAGEHTADDLQHVRGISGLRQDVGNPAGQRKRPRLALAVVRGIEHHGDRTRGRIETKLPDELIAVHHRHEHIGNHQIGVIGLDGSKSLASIRRLEHPVPLMTQERDQEFPVGRKVVNDQNGRHISLGGTLRAGRERKPG